MNQVSWGLVMSDIHAIGISFVYTSVLPHQKNKKQKSRKKRKFET